MRRSSLLLALVLVFCYSLVLSMNLIAAENESTKVIMLGTGTPIPDPERSGPGVAIVVGDESYLVDFGPGIVRRAAAMSPRFGGQYEALEAKNLDTAFLTHLHSDHSAGFPDLILSPWVEDREVPLKVYGPEGIKQMAKYILKAYDTDIKYRLYSNQPANDQGWRVNAQEIKKDGEIYRDDHVVVDAFRVVHGNWPNAFAYKFQAHDKTIVVSGDIAYEAGIAEFAKGADILVHEVFVDKGLRENRPPKWQAYHESNHTSAVDLGKVAQQAGVQTLVLYHILMFESTEEQLIEEIKQNFTGEVIIGRDLQVIE